MSAWLSDAVLQHLAEAAEAPDLSGTRYVLRERLGRGGMGTVFLAFDAQLEREVAVKVSAHAHGPELAERLTREAKVIAALEHPGIVPVHDAGVLPDGRVYYVMKRVRGQRLDVWADEHPQRERLQLFRRICDAVAFAHSRGVLHRDLKPQNVMVGEFGEALVMDWGLAKTKDVREPSSVVVGTPTFMAPEQARGESVGAAADVWALGALLRTLVSEPTPALVAICDKACAPEPGSRYAAARELSDDVGRLLDQEPVRARREGPLEKVVRFTAKNRVVLSLLAAYLLVRALLIWLG